MAYPLLFMCLIIIFASSCKKGDDLNNSNTFKDSRDGNVYKIITIGNQVWMAENLKFLPSVVGPATGSQTVPYYYVYDYKGENVADAKATANYSIYGVLYNWPAAMNGAESSENNPSGVQGVCPTGWHLPSDAEWSQLTDYLGGELVAGSKLKEIDTTHWNSPNEATNETGFTALPGGFCNQREGTFRTIGYGSYLWSTTAAFTDEIWFRSLYYTDRNVVSTSSSMSKGYSVRCVRD